MKILDTNKFIEDLTNVINDVGCATDKALAEKGKKSRIVITNESVLTKDENGSIYFKICTKEGKNAKNVALYIFERKNGITTFIINGETMDLLFENATIKSPEISLTYLKTILEGNVKWLLNTKNKKPDFKPKKKFSNKNRKPGMRKGNHQGDKKPFKNTGDRKPYKKNSNGKYGGSKNGKSQNSCGKPRYDRNGHPSFRSKENTFVAHKPYIKRNNNGTYSATTKTAGKMPTENESK